jgi:hypothetical protein
MRVVYQVRDSGKDGGDDRGRFVGSDSNSVIEAAGVPASSRSKRTAAGALEEVP